MVQNCTLVTIWENEIEECYAVCVEVSGKHGAGERTDYMMANSPEEARQKTREKYLFGDAILDKIVAVKLVSQ